MMKSNLPIKKTDFCSECLNCANTNQCSKCARKCFTTECVPLTNVINARINILNWEKTDYMWYNGEMSQTFAINKNFELEAYEGEKINHEHFLINDYLISKLNENIIINMIDNEIKIPIYYMFVNKNILPPISLSNLLTLFSHHIFHSKNLLTF